MAKTIHCGDPVIPRYGYMMESSEFTYPNTVTFSCDQGYVLQGTAIIRCESNGHWNPSPPKCQPADGPFPWWVLVIVVVIFLSMSTYIVAKCFLKYCGDGEEDPGGLGEAEERESLQAEERQQGNDQTDKVTDKGRGGGGGGAGVVVTQLNLDDR